MKNIILILFFLINIKLISQSNYPPKNINGSIEYVYKKTKDVDLKIWVFNPEFHNISIKKPAIVFFFGGGYRNGTPDQFVEHAKYFRSRGMVGIIADYRVSSRHNVKVINSISDGKSTIKWIKENSNILGIDPKKIVASGGSSGGNLAASTAILVAHDDPQDNPKYNSKPSALILFNPSLGTGKERWLINKQIINRIGTRDYYSISPYHNLKEGLPPTIIFHGTNDQTVPFSTVKLFTKKMIEMGNSCILYPYKGEEHAFFNYGRNGNRSFKDTIEKADNFLVSLGYIKPLINSR